jgi:ABC-2 type transport system ATP-binding protein
MDYARGAGKKDGLASFVNRNLHLQGKASAGRGSRSHGPHLRREHAWGTVAARMSAIETRDLTKVYRTYKKAPGLWGAVKGLGHREYEAVRAADGVTFSIEEGEFVGFLGPNGAGKTTVLKMLSGLLNPTSGSAKVLGHVPWERKDALKRQFSLLMGQKNALWWDLPARESLELNRAIYGIERAAFTKIVGELTELLDCADKLDVMVRELSLGERMKMELIAALLHSPKVLFLDEPTIGLDVTSQKKVREFLRRYNAENRIVTMLTSHYMQDIEELCARVIIIDAGRIFFDGPLSSVIDRFATHKIVGLEFADGAACDFAGLGEIVERTPSSVRLKVPRAKVAETCREVLSACQVTDLSVEELPVEEVIRQLFHEQAVQT